MHGHAAPDLTGNGHSRVLQAHLARQIAAVSFITHLPTRLHHLAAVLVPHLLPSAPQPLPSLHVPLTYSIGKYQGLVLIAWRV